MSCASGDCSSLSSEGEGKGRRPVRTLLAHTEEFGQAISKLVVDKTTGGFVKKEVIPPESFDGRKVWKNYLPPVRDQGSCGACWAFAISACLSARIAIATGGHHKPFLSPAGAVYCNLGSESELEMALKRIKEGLPYDYTPPQLRALAKEEEKEGAKAVGCQGETLVGAWQYAGRFGLMVEDCVPYDGWPTVPGSNLKTQGSDGGDMPVCSEVIGESYDTCPETGKPLQRYQCGSYYYVPGTPAKKETAVDVTSLYTDEDGMRDETTMAATYEQKEIEETGPGETDGSEYNIRREIYHWGPVTSGFIVHSDFQEWDGKEGEVYKWDGISEEVGGHAIIILGWGTTSDGIDYWIVRNSWGPNWGDHGHFKIKRGTNECGIEENVVVGFPELYGFRLYTENPILFREDDYIIRAIWRLLPSGHKITTAERMLDGRMVPSAVDLDEVQFDTDWWPDLSTFVAGEPRKTHFPLQRSRLSQMISPRNQTERVKLLHQGIALGVGALIAGGVAYYLFIKKKK